MGYQVEKKVWNIYPFQYNTRVWRTDGRRDTGRVLPRLRIASRCKTENQKSNPNLNPNRARTGIPKAKAHLIPDPKQTPFRYISCKRITTSLDITSVEA